jgi:uncharacterized protein YneR
VAAIFFVVFKNNRGLSNNVSDTVSGIDFEKFTSEENRTFLENNFSDNIYHLYCTIFETEKPNEIFYLNLVSLKSTFLVFSRLRNENNISEVYNSSTDRDGFFEIKNPDQDRYSVETSFGKVKFSSLLEQKRHAIINDKNSKNIYQYAIFDINKGELTVDNKNIEVNGVCEGDVTGLKENGENFSQYNQMNISLNNGYSIVLAFDTPEEIVKDLKIKNTVFIMNEKGEYKFIDDFELNAFEEIESKEEPFNKISKRFVLSIPSEKINLEINSIYDDPFLNPCFAFNNGKVTGSFDGEGIDGASLIMASFGPECFSEYYIK